MLVHNLTNDQLLKIDRAIDVFLFKEGTKEESWADSYKKDPKAFNKLISSMSAYKQQLMKYFRQQYDNRYLLIRAHVVRADEGDDDEEEQYNNSFYDPQWQNDNQKLAGVLENNNTMGWTLGIAAVAYSSGRQIDLTPADFQPKITSRALDMATAINETTKKRAYAAIQASLALNEDRTMLDARLKQIFISPYRGMLIAQNELLNSYLEAKQYSAVNEGFKFKTWVAKLATDIVCGDVDGETVGIDDDFSNGLTAPLAHMNCRCDIEYS